jgi:Lar family restriction alleviation protein
VLTLKDAKPCPFCGGRKFKLEDIGGESYLFVQCLGCRAEGPHDDEAEREHAAVTRWNNRKK